MTKNNVILFYAVFLVLLSFVTFVMYGIDKRKATKGRWRIPEKVLLLSSFIGGAFGGFAGMKIFHHKTTGEHWYFTVVNILGIIIHSGLMVYLIFFTNF